MQEDDWLMKQLRILPIKLPSIKQHNREPLIDLEDPETKERHSVSLTQYLLHQILHLKLEDAENKLFEYAHDLSLSQLKQTSKWFYEKLDSLSDDELREGNFSRAEITQGRNDIYNIYSSEIDF